MTGKSHKGANSGEGVGGEQYQLRKNPVFEIADVANQHDKIFLGVLFWSTSARTII